MVQHQHIEGLENRVEVLFVIAAPLDPFLRRRGGIARFVSRPMAEPNNDGPLLQELATKRLPEGSTHACDADAGTAPR